VADKYKYLPYYIKLNVIFVVQKLLNLSIGTVKVDVFFHILRVPFPVVEIQFTLFLKHKLTRLSVKVLNYVLLI
jgi:hypothetical protein